MFWNKINMYLHYLHACMHLCYHLYEEVCFHETKRLWAGVCHLLLIAVFSVKRLI